VDKSVITRVVMVAGGRFAPGHLGELTQQVPFEMVDAVLEQTCRVERRVRDLPARVVVYLLLAGCLFAELGYAQVWRRLAAGLDGLSAAPAASAVTQARRRLGPGPLRELFALLRGPGPSGARWRGLLVCAIDGTVMSVADSAANLAVYSKHGGASGGSSYPALRLLALVSCGTRSVIDAVFGPLSSGETSYAPLLPGSLRAGMLLPADRNFGSGPLAAQVRQTGADFLIRVRTGNNSPGLPVLRRLPDGSWLSRFGAAPVRVIDAEITITTSAGRAASRCRLVTTLAGPARYPAGDLAVLYHERWEIEMVFTQLAKRAVWPLGGGREDVADLDLVVSDDHAVDEQFGEQPPLLEGGGGEPGPDGLAEALDPVGGGLEFKPLPGGGIELPLLGGQGGMPAVQVLAFALEFGQPDDLGEVGVQQSLLLAV
jgi:hypothetical protein